MISSGYQVLGIKNGKLKCHVYSQIKIPDFRDFILETMRRFFDGEEERSFFNSVAIFRNQKWNKKIENESITFIVK